MKDQLDLDELTEDWGAVKLLPQRTGLTRAIWITENASFRHDVRVKVSRLRGGRGSWRDSLSVSVRPDCKEIVPPGGQPQLPSDELAEVCEWIALNMAVIVAFWDGVIDFVEAASRLRRRYG